MYLVRELLELTILNTRPLLFRLPDSLSRWRHRAFADRMRARVSSDTSRQEIARLCSLLVFQIELKGFIEWYSGVQLSVSVRYAYTCVSHCCRRPVALILFP